jgi:crotonobetainyl-CoA:carnitine CoA-transferase CaiB-like acyl-CoA transferase
MLPTRLGNAHPNIVPYQVFATADGHIILAVANDGQFRRFCVAAELDLSERYPTNAQRVNNREILVALLNPVFAARTTADWIGLLEAANVPCGPINRIDQVFADPQAIARGLKITMPHASGPLELVASPIRLEKTPPEYRSAPPLLGQHTDEVLSQMLALSDVEIARLRKSGVVA